MVLNRIVISVGGEGEKNMKINSTAPKPHTDLLAKDGNFISSRHLSTTSDQSLSEY